MQNEHTKAMRGLNIAVIVMSALTICGLLIGAVALGLGTAVLNEYGPEAIQYSQNHPDHSMAAHLHDDYYDVDVDIDAGDLMELANVGVAMGFAGIGWELITCVVTLIAAIVSVRNADKREKLGLLFGWGIAGAVAAFLGGRIITCVLMVISVVFAQKDKNAPEAAWRAAQNGGVYGGVPVYGASGAPSYGAPSYGQPYGQQGYAQPAYGQPVQPAPHYAQTYCQPEPADAQAQGAVPAQPYAAPAYGQPQAQPVVADPQAQAAQSAAPADAQQPQPEQPAAAASADEQPSDAPKNE